MDRENSWRGSVDTQSRNLCSYVFWPNETEDTLAETEDWMCAVFQVQ